SSLIPQLHVLLGYEIGFIKSIEDISSYLETYSQPGLLENIKSFSGELENSKDVAKRLSEGFDAYVNNAFATCHRTYASIVAITEFLPSYAGFIIEEETNRLRGAMDASK